MNEDDLFRITAEQAKLGTNFMAIHTGINWETVKRLRNQGRHARTGFPGRCIHDRMDAPQ